MAKYKVIITSDSDPGREYDSDSRNALALAHKYGRGELGKVVSVYTRSGRLVAMAGWTPREGGRYHCYYVPAR